MSTRRVVTVTKLDTPRDLCAHGDRYRNCQRKGWYFVIGSRNCRNGAYCAQHAKMYVGESVFLAVTR